MVDWLHMQRISVFPYHDMLQGCNPDLEAIHFDIYLPIEKVKKSYNTYDDSRIKNSCDIRKSVHQSYKVTLSKQESKRSSMQKID